MPILEQGQAGTTLSETVSANAFWDIRYLWTISKTATPEILNLFRNDTGTVQYTITVTNDAGTSEAYIEGLVCITNGGSVATEGLASTLVLQTPTGTTILTQALDVSPNPILGIGQTFCYPYRIDIPMNLFVPGQSFKVTANTTILNHSGHIGEPFGPSASASGNLPTTRSTVNESINVNDTNGFSFVFNATDPPELKTRTYTKDYSCNSDQGSHTNTATIVQTGQSASAAVLVNCYDLIVTKTVQPAFTRIYSWRISKRAVDSNGAEVTTLTLGLNETFTVRYIIDVTRTFTDTNFRVTGTITVVNPNPDKTANVLISDLILPDGINSTVTPASISVLPNSSATVNYTAVLPNNLSRTDQATALLFNTPSGTTPFSSLAIPFDFSNAAITEIDACINVIDSFMGPLVPSPICNNYQFTYDRAFGPYTACTGAIQFPNTAAFTTIDTQTTGSADWAIMVTVPCQGCTLTIGYWKTHAGFGPQPDVVTPLLPINLGTPGGVLTVNVTTAAQAVSILSFGGSNGVIDAANGINRLYAQLLAAKLNIKSGADPSVIESTILAADAFLANNNSSSWARLSRANRTYVNNLQTLLDNYNNGLIGPGHCSEQTDFSSAQLTAALATEAAETDDTSITAQTDETNIFSELYPYLFTGKLASVLGQNAEQIADDSSDNSYYWKFRGQCCGNSRPRMR